MPLDAENFSASTHIFKFKIQKKIKKQKKNWEIEKLIKNFVEPIILNLFIYLVTNYIDSL